MRKFTSPVYLFNRTALKALLLALSLATFIFPGITFAENGITIQGPRIIYPAGTIQTSVILRNTSKTDTFLMLAWVAGASQHSSVRLSGNRDNAGRFISV